MRFREWWGGGGEERGRGIGTTLVMKVRTIPAAGCVHGEQRGGRTRERRPEAAGETAGAAWAGPGTAQARVPSSEQAAPLQREDSHC